MQRLLVVFDCDSTLIQEEAIELLADLVGVRNAVAEVTDRAMRGELDFAESLRERVQLLAGASIEDVRACARLVHPSPGLADVVSAVHAAGGEIGVVSGGFHELLDEFATDLGVDRWRANRLEQRDGALTGKLSGEIIDARAKAHALREWAAKLEIPGARTVAIGDGANDLEMMRAAGLSIAFNAKPVVREAADLAIDRSLGDALPALETIA